MTLIASSGAAKGAFPDGPSSVPLEAHSQDDVGGADGHGGRVVDEEGGGEAEEGKGGQSAQAEGAHGISAGE